MADRHELNIIISETGDVQIEVSGVKGPQCLKITEDIENALGEIISREKKSEFYRTDTDASIKSKIGE